MKMTKTEQRIFALLSEHIGETVSHADLLHIVWGYPPDLAEKMVNKTRTVHMAMSRLNKKLNGQIEKHYGIGYRLQGPQ